jgi:hypothetical protein
MLMVKVMSMLTLKLMSIVKLILMLELIGFYMFLLTMRILIKSLKQNIFKNSLETLLLMSPSMLMLEVMSTLMLILELPAT